MNRLLRKWMVLSWILTAWPGLAEPASTAGGDESSLKITVRVYNYARVSALRKLNYPLLGHEDEP